jgi:pimeloyl-ACP methyl ester carboxylesterase
VVTYRSRESGRFTDDDLTEELVSIIRDLGEERATILGESFGGTVALNFALRYPRIVERLVVVNSFPRFRRRFTIEVGPLLATAVPFHLLWPVRRAASLVALLADGVSRADRRVFWRAIRTVNREGYARRLRLIAALDLEPRLSEIQCPTLFVAGEKDLLIPSATEALRMASQMPHAEVRVIKGAGHACLLGNRVRLAELLSE